ncbi:hypothetical protein KIF59_17485 [Enterobacter cloacae subsp. cloacae]|nr:hypothetical protein [Enterobacter cloacae subsp. cloacae]
MLIPICLSIWLAHRGRKKKFVDALDSYASRVLLRTDRVVGQAKEALTQLQTFKALRVAIAFTGNAPDRLLVALCSGSDLRGNLKPLCSSLLEQVSKATAFPPPMRITEDGYSAWLTKAK